MARPERTAKRHGIDLGDGYLTISDAAAEYHVSRHKIARLIRAGELAAYTNPYDRRYRYVARTDLEQLQSTLRRVEPGEKGTER